MSKRNANTTTAPTDATPNTPANPDATPAWISERIKAAAANPPAPRDVKNEGRAHDDEPSTDDLAADLVVKVTAKGGISIGSDRFEKGAVLRITKDHAASLERMVGHHLELALAGEFSPHEVRTPAPRGPDPNIAQKRAALTSRYLEELVADKVDAFLKAEASEAAERSRVVAEAALKSLARKRIAAARAASERANDLRRDADRLDAESRKLADRFAGIELGPEPAPPPPPAPIDFTPLGNIYGTSFS